VQFLTVRAAVMSSSDGHHEPPAPVAMPKTVLELMR
jgi:hypothetical protein